MALEQKLSLKLAQKLVMTPSLQQAIKLLQMTRMELETLLSQELVENPVLEESGEITEEEAAPREEERQEAQANGEELNHGESMENIDLDAYFGDYWEGSGHSSMMEERDDPPIENSLTREPDLYDHLLWQLHMADVTPRQREIAELIIGNLNPDGFLAATPEEIRAMGDLDGEQRYTMAEIEDALGVVRSFDPPGIACCDLRESLLVQMDVLGVEPDALARRMVLEAWDLFLRRQFPAVAKKLGVELPELEAALELIRTLETQPGRKFSTERPHYIEPDVFVRRVGEEYVIQLNDDGLPRLRVSRA
jgi:RNA polymerase sigma-54 factor